MKSRSVLVVEDSAGNAELAAALLALEGWHVDHAGDGARALARLAESCPDVVLLDLLMPGMSGLALLREMARDAMLRGLPVVVLTAADDGLLAQAQAARPGVTVLQKPAEPQAILRALAEAVRGAGGPVP